MFRAVSALLFSAGFAFLTDPYALHAVPSLSQQSAAEEVLTNETLIKLVKAGIRVDVIVEMIGSQPGKYSVSPKAVIAMKEAGVSDDVIAAMVSRSKDSQQQDAQEAQISKPTNSPPLPPPALDVPTAGEPRKLNVVARATSTT